MAGIDIHRTEVGQLEIELSSCRPAAFVVEFQQAKFVHPYFTAFLTAGKVAYTDDHRLHFTECRITHHRHLIGRTVGVVDGESPVVACRSCTPCLVALFLHGGEQLQRDVKHVLLGPYDAAVMAGVHIIMSRSRQLQRDFILVVVVLVIRAQTDEHSQLVVSQVGRVLFEGVGVYEHLQPLVLAQVEGSVLVDSLRLACTQVVDDHGECLLVLFDKLWLVRILSTADARRQDVVHGHLVVVLLKAHGTYRHRTCIAGRVGEVLLILPPLAADEVERTEAEDDGFLETCEEHTHEADAGEVADVAYTFLEFLQRDAELIPRDGF